MRNGTLYSICFLALFIWNCPKRQTVSRIVYVPPPPPAAETSAPSQTEDALIIPEPQPPEPEEVEPTEEPQPTAPPVKRRPRPARTEPALEPAPEPEPPPAAEVPALEPRESPLQQAAQRQEIANLRDQVQARMNRLENTNLSDTERRTLENARTFLSQSESALQTNDLQRARTLVRKASMLAAVLEQQ